MRPESKVIVEEILHFIQSASSVSETDEAYARLALNIFKHQFTFNLPYKKYCQARRKTPLTVRRWQDIPPIPIQAFKELNLSTEPPENSEAVFMTSGTTNADKRGRNYHPTLEVWDVSMVPPFKQYVLPDRESMAIFVISPAEDFNQNSSLSRYLTMAVRHFGTSRSMFFFKKDTGLDMEALAVSLKACEERDEPVMIMGATFAYVHFLDYCAAHSLRFKLAKGSRIFDTGGLKGQAREISLEDLYLSFTQYFQLERKDFINMYGMTELSSQLYDRTFIDRKDNPSAAKVGPAWLKTVVLHPDTLEPVETGEIGVLAHYDLANWNSAMAILTEDRGYLTQDGLVLLGRISGSEARGCSIAVDQLLQANRK